MKKTLLLFIVLLFIFGCKQKDKKWDNIEVLAYRHWNYLPEDSINNSKPALICGFYTLIDNNGSSKMGVQRYFYGFDLKFYTINLDRNIIENLADSLLLLKPINDFVHKISGIYEGPGIKIRINKGSESKTITFINHIDSTNKVYVNFYRYLNSFLESFKIYPTKDTVLTLKRMNEFINYSLKIDSLYYSCPVEFVPPIINSEPIKKKHHYNHPKKE